MILKKICGLIASSANNYGSKQKKSGYNANYNQYQLQL